MSRHRRLSSYNNFIEPFIVGEMSSKLHINFIIYFIFLNLRPVHKPNGQGDLPFATDSPPALPPPLAPPFAISENSLLIF